MFLLLPFYFLSHSLTLFSAHLKLKLSLNLKLNLKLKLKWPALVSGVGANIVPVEQEPQKVAHNMDWP